jgi:hypothetical protein
VTTALTTARPNKVLCLSTIGADAPHDNLLTQRTLMEQTLGALGLPERRRGAEGEHGALRGYQGPGRRGWKK